MTTAEFNNARAKSWANKFTEDKSRIFLMIGMKEDKTHTFLVDDISNPQQVADKLESLAKSIREKHK